MILSHFDLQVHGKRIILLLAALLLSGCAANQALNDMKETKAAYKDCVAQHPKDVSVACKREKEAYESAGQAYEGMTRGGNNLDAGTSRH